METLLLKSISNETLVLCATKSEMRQNPLNLTPTAVFIRARRLQMPNYHIISQNDH